MLAAGDDSVELNRCATDDVFCLCYTSGTTGVPKGVKLSHRMYMMGVTASLVHSPIPEDNFTKDDCYISFLPSAHSYE